MSNKTSSPWPWYWIVMLAILLVVVDAILYGGAVPFLFSAPDWWQVGLGVILAFPAGFAFNIWIIKMIWSKIKSLSSKEVSS